MFSSDSSLSEVNEYINNLVVEACKYPQKSKNRRQKLTEIINYIRKSGRLWKENTPYYQDALQQTWLYLCRNIEQYQPNSANSSSLITLLDSHLKWRLYDFRQDVKKAKNVISLNVKPVIDSVDDNDDIFEQVEILPSNPEIPPILEEVRQWAKTDVDGELRRTYLKGHPDVNCQTLILLRLPPETEWHIIAKRFNLSQSTIATFYKRESWPRLQKFGILQGYLESDYE